MEKDAKTFLAFLRELDNFNDKFGRELNKPNFFSAAGLLRQEIKHSSILAFLLDPRGWHGLGEKFLRNLVHLALREPRETFSDADAIDLALNSLNDAIVSKEVPVLGENRAGRLDILVYSKSAKFLLVVENKVDASQSDGQLSKYKSWVEAGAVRWGSSIRKIYVYLVLDGNDEAEEGWVKITYDQVKIALRECAAREPSMPELGRIFINQYIDLIENHIMKNDSDEMISTIHRLWSEYRELLLKIVENQPVPSIDAMKNFLDQRRDGAVVHEKVAMNRGVLCFIPNDLVAELQEWGKEKVDMETVTWDWPSPTYPLRLMFVFSAKGSVQSLQLKLFVGPFSGREKFINILRDYISRPPRARENASSYTQIWASRILDIEEDSGFILRQMNKLFDEYSGSTHESVIAAVKRWGRECS